LIWPNDVLIGGAKLGGILAEWLMDDAVVLGIGLNVRHSPGGLAYPTTCLAAEGCELDAPAVLLQLVDVVAAGMDAWCARVRAGAGGLDGTRAGIGHGRWLHYVGRQRETGEVVTTSVDQSNDPVRPRTGRQGRSARRSRHPPRAGSR